MVVNLVAHNPHAVSPRTRCDISVVNSDMHQAVVGVDQPIALGCGLVEIGDVSSGRIRALEGGLGDLLQTTI